MNERILIAIILMLGIKGFGCPNHCFCYKWRGLFRTDCVKRNLFNTFIGFPHSTQVLDLSYNVLTILHGNEFLDANLRLLQNLNISNNRLHKIDRLSFNGLQFLESLDLSFNVIEHLAPTTFIYNSYLKTLNISYNYLSVKKDNPFLASASLQILDIANCKVEFLSARTFFKLTKLEVLNVSQNYIGDIKPEVVEGVTNLKYMDVSKNDLHCNEQTSAFLQTLISRGIQFPSFCQTGQKIMMTPVVQNEEKPQIQLFPQEPENMTRVFQNQLNVFENIRQFFESLPPIYVLLCGIQLGILTGTIITYFYMKKAKKNSNEPVIERPVRINNDSDHLTFSLVHLNAPPGTPPSPYQSRVFTDFPLSIT